MTKLRCVTAPSMTKFRSVTALSKATERHVLTNIALPVFIVSRSVFSVAGAGDHQPMMVRYHLTKVVKSQQAPLRVVCMV
jgi:hypothetical protein